MKDKLEDKEKPVKDEDFNDFVKIDLNKPEITKIVLFKKEGIPFKKDDKIAYYYLNDKKEKKIFVKSPIYGWILKYISDDKKIILEPCKHDTFYFNVCTKCGFEKTENNNINRSYGFLNKGFTYSKEKAEKLEKTYINNYLEQKKLILLLDLDNTIIHTSPRGLAKEDVDYLKKQYNKYFGEIYIKNEFNRFDYILAKFRPFLKTFLKNIKDKYEIFIYTQGTKEYATSIIEYINSNFEKDSLSTERMMYRVLDENGYAKSKSIKNVFPTQEKMVLIIDDLIEVWKENEDNLICIYPYKFFSEKEKNNNEMAPSNKNNIKKEKYLKSEYDYVLYYITNLLLAIHRKFYDFYSQFKMQKSIKRILNDLFLSVFHGKKFYYHINYYNYPIINTKRVKKVKEKQKNDNFEDKNNQNEENKNNLNIKNISESNNLENKEKENINIEESKIGVDAINKSNEENTEEEKKENKDINIKPRNLEEEKKILAKIKKKIEKLGGKLIENEKDIFNSDLLLIDFYDENDPIIKDVEKNNSDEKNKKLPIIHSHYIEICLMYLYEVSIDDFILSPNFKFLKFLDLNKVFDRNKINIINFYGNKDFIDENII